MIIIGLGTGRSGSVSLHRFLNAQPATVMFHEMNVPLVAWEGTWRSIENTLEEYQTLLDGGARERLSGDLTNGRTRDGIAKLKQGEPLSYIGDTGAYYLNYVEQIIAHFPTARFICQRRDKAATVKSWYRKVTIKRHWARTLAERLAQVLFGRKYYEQENRWIAHDGSKWRVNKLWDKCFPKFETDDIEEAINLYWDYYYERAEAFAQQYPEQFLLIEIEEFNSAPGQEKLLDFLDYPKEGRALGEFRANQQRSVS